MYKAAVMGDIDSIYGFACLGLNTFPVKTAEESKKTFKSLCGGKYAVIYITEACAEELEEEIERMAENPLPAVILIPGVSGITG